MLEDLQDSRLRVIVGMLKMIMENLWGVLDIDIGMKLKIFL